MVSYKILLSKSVKQDVHKIDVDQIPRIMVAVRALADNPFPQGSKKLKGSRSNYRIRVGQYRVVYEVDIETSTVTIFRIRHRRDVYK